jgi:hypothetical protein
MTASALRKGWIDQIGGKKYGKQFVAGWLRFGRFGSV